MILIDRDRLVKQKGNIDFEKIYVIKNKFENFLLLQETMIDLFISFNKEKL